MARARNIKPGFFKNEVLGTQEPIVMLLFAGLWTLADKAGRLEDRPLRIKAELFPYRDKLDVNRYLTVLEQLGFLRRYQVDGMAIIQVVNFEKHQHPHHTEKESELPEFKEGSSLTVKAPEVHGDTPSDSLIPDSLIPFKDIVGLKPNGSQLKADAKDILGFLNEKAGKAFRLTDANLDFIVARFREGYTPAQCRQVVAKKCREWVADEKMREYLRPSTIFNREKFNQYAGELVIREANP